MSLPLRGPALHEAVRDYIKQYILDRKLKPGDPLPPEGQLAQELGVGRSSVREAVKALQSLGIIEARQGNGLQFKGDAQVLAGRVIGAYGPSVTALTLAQLIEAVPRARSEVEPDNRTVLRKLSAGRYGEDGLALVNEAVAEVLMREDGIRNLQPAGVVKAFGYAFGLSRQTVDPAQSLALGKALHELCRSGRTAELLKPYGLPGSACVKPEGVK